MLLRAVPFVERLFRRSCCNLRSASSPRSHACNRKRAQRPACEQGRDSTLFTCAPCPQASGPNSKKRALGVDGLLARVPPQGETNREIGRTLGTDPRKRKQAGRGGPARSCLIWEPAYGLASPGPVGLSGSQFLIIG